MSLKNKLFQKKNLWHVGAIAFFVLISVIYLSPTLKGYQIEQSDVKNWSGAAQEIIDYRNNNEDEALWTNSMFGGMPATQISVNNESRLLFNKIRSAFTLWLPHPIDYFLLGFIGFYILGITLKLKPMVAILGSVAYGLSSFFIIILQVGHNTQLLAIGFAPMVVAGFLMAYRRKKWYLGVALSSLFMAFELSSNHLQMTYYLGMLLIGLGFVELYKHIKEKQLKKFGIVTVGLLAAYLIAFGIDYGSIKGTEEYAKFTTRNGSNLSINSDGTAKAEGTGSTGLSKDYILHHSYGLDETFTLIIPNFKGGASNLIGNIESNKSILKDYNKEWKAEMRDLQKSLNSNQNQDDMIRYQALQSVQSQIKSSMQYFGNQPGTSGPVYVGIIVVFLALLALYYLDDKIKWALLIVTILTIMLSWGKNLLGYSEFFIDYIPGYNKFRSVTFILFVAELAIPILAVLFINKLIKKREEIEKNIKPFLIISGIFTLLILSFLITPNLFNTFLLDGELAQLNSIENPDQYLFVSEMFSEIENVRISIFRKEVLRGLFFLVCGISVILVAIKNSKFAASFMTPILILLILVDLVLVDSRYLGQETSGKDKQWTESWKHAYPYDAAKGDEIIFSNEAQENPEIAQEVKTAISEIKKEKKDEKLKPAHLQKITDWEKYRTLNRNTHFRVYEEGNPFNSSRTSYYHKSIGGYHGAKLQRIQEMIEFHISKNNTVVLDMLNTKYMMSYGGKSANENPNALGNAWFVKNVKTVDSNEDEILGLCGKYKLTSTGKLPILVNKIPMSNSQEVKGIETVTLLIPNQQTPMVNDTIPFQLPLSVGIGQKLSYISTPEGTQWAYTAMLDSTSAANQIAQFETLELFDPKNDVIVHSEFKDKLSSENYTGQGSIKLDSYSPKKLEYTAVTNQNQLAIFSEIYYPLGWAAKIDGKEVDYLRANYILRALEIPAGEHKVVFEYDSKSYHTGSIYTWVSTILILTFIGLALYFENKKSESTEETLA
jgi:hypothetical protein